MFEHKGYKIDVTTHGTFICNPADDIEMEDKTLEGLKLRLDKLATTEKKTVNLPVVGILRGDNYNTRKDTKPRVYRTAVIGINRTSRALQFSDLPKHTKLDDVLADTPENTALLEKWLAVKQEHESVGAQVNGRELQIPGYGRLDPGPPYNEALKALQVAHGRSAKGKPTE